MRAAYITTYDSNDPHAWSGLGKRIRLALADSGVDVHPVGPLSHKYGTWFNLKERLHRTLSTGIYAADREPLLLRHYAREVSRALRNVEHDLVFSPGTIPIAALETNKPIVFWTDATFAAMVNYYPGFTGLVSAAITNGNRAEQRALSRASLAMYSSQWAADSAVQRYDVDPAKVKVVPFGANIDSMRTVADVDALIAARSLNPVRLLFVGTEWERKRGAFAIRVAEILNERGTQTHLHLVGAEPAVETPPFVTVHGFISNETADGCQELDALFGASTFLILPSTAECCAVVLAEASAFGVPSLTTRVGGNQTAVRDGVNGQTFEVTDRPAAYCDSILKTLATRSRYAALARSSFLEYQSRLNWKTAGARAVALISERCGL